MEDYGISKEEMADLYSKTNGDMSEVRRLLQGKKVVTWSQLEDLALLMPEDSEEFIVLLRTKGRKSGDSCHLAWNLFPCSSSVNPCQRILDRFQCCHTSA